MTRNNADFHAGRLPNPDDVVAAARSGYITKEQAGDLHPKVKRFLQSKGNPKTSDAEVETANRRVDNIKEGGTPGKMWRSG